MTQHFLTRAITGLAETQSEAGHEEHMGNSTFNSTLNATLDSSLNITELFS